VTQREADEREYKTKGKKALEEVRKSLIKSGFDEERIVTKVRFRMISKVDDIIQEGSQGLYDAVVLGRRGLSRLEEVFDESVSSGILQKTYDFPFWLCRVPDLKRKNVLLCTDGSKPSYRIADHVGFILSSDDKHRVTILQIKKDRKDRNTEKIFEAVKEHLAKNGFPGERIDAKVIEDSNPAKAILKEADQGEYAVVAAGWTGRGKGILKHLFSGSNSYTLFRELERAALWTSY